MTRIFIDGSAGTTGLRIRERLAARKDLDLITLPEEVRKDPVARQEALNTAERDPQRTAELIRDFILKQ